MSPSSETATSTVVSARLASIAGTDHHLASPSAAKAGPAKA
jgi:hypothetical protein